MVVYEKNGKDLSVVTIDKALEEKILEEAKNYQLVKERTITWERLDDDRSGEDTDFFYYSLTEKEKCPVDFSFVVQNNNLIGIKIYYTSTTSWNAGLSKESSLGGCVLYIDGKVDGSNTSCSTYDSPNNYDEVKTSYYLQKIK